MSRAFGLVALVCSLGIVAILMAMNMSNNGPTSSSAKKAEAEATAAVGSLNFTGAATELEAYKAEHATYAAAALPPSFGVTVVRADAASYCLQAGVGGAVQHYLGPGGTPAAGAC
jgi:type II secretory pathway pseudopilin PulG